MFLLPYALTPEITLSGRSQFASISAPVPRFPRRREGCHFAATLRLPSSDEPTVRCCTSGGGSGRTLAVQDPRPAVVPSSRPRPLPAPVAWGLARRGHAGLS